MSMSPYEIERMIQQLNHPSKKHELEKHKSELANIANKMELKLEGNAKNNTIQWGTFRFILKTNFNIKLKIFDKKYTKDQIMTHQMINTVCDLTRIIIFYNAIGNIIALYNKNITVFINLDFHLF